MLPHYTSLHHKEYICILPHISILGYIGVYVMRKCWLQKKDLTIETHVGKRINRHPNIVAIYAVDVLGQNSNMNVRKQVRNCWNYCVKKGWKVEYIFIDRQKRLDKTSKSNFDNFIGKVNSGDFDVIVFSNLGKIDESTLSVPRKYDKKRHKL